MAKVFRVENYETEKILTLNENEGFKSIINAIKYCCFLVWKMITEIIWDYHYGYTIFFFVLCIIFGICTFVYFIKLCRLIYYKGDLPESKKINKKKEE